jgi:hypothetical protein
MEDEMPNPLALSFFFRFHKHGHDYIPKKKQIEFWNFVTKQLPPLQIKQIWKYLLNSSIIHDYSLSRMGIDFSWKIFGKERIWK